jgi:hypothetical protein
MHAAGAVRIGRLRRISPSHREAAMAFTLKINGTPHKVDVDGDTPLLWVRGRKMRPILTIRRREFIALVGGAGPVRLVRTPANVLFNRHLSP